MAFKNQKDSQSNKRKRIPGATKGDDGGKFSPKKKLRTPSNNQPNKGFKKPFDSKAAGQSNKGFKKPFESKAAGGKPKYNKSDTSQDAPKTKRELRIQAKVCVAFSIGICFPLLFILTVVKELHLNFRCQRGYVFHLHYRYVISTFRQKNC